MLYNTILQYACLWVVNHVCSFFLLNLIVNCMPYISNYLYQNQMNSTLVLIFTPLPKTISVAIHNSVSCHENKFSDFNYTVLLIFCTVSAFSFCTIVLYFHCTLPLHQQKIYPSGRNGSVRVDALRQSCQRQPGGGLLSAWCQFNASRSISPSDRCFSISSHSVGLLF